jgi:hypothetical protein
MPQLTNGIIFISEFSVRIPVQECVLETMHSVSTVDVKKLIFENLS